MKIPFWIWPLAGLICIALSIPGFLAAVASNQREAALSQDKPELVDLENFSLETDIGLANEVNVFAQTNDNYRFMIEGAGFGTGSRYLVPLFSALAAPDTKNVQYALLVDDLEAFDLWLAENVAGNARLGDLYAINGQVIDGRGYTAAMRITLRDAGLEQADNLTIIDPFIEGREGGFVSGNATSVRTPLILSAIGIWCIGFGWLVWHRAWKMRRNVNKRIGSIEKPASMPSKAPVTKANGKVELKVVADSKKGKSRSTSAEAALLNAAKKAKQPSPQKKSSSGGS